MNTHTSLYEIMMLLMGMCTSLTKKPMNPIIKKPMPVAKAIRVNSAQQTSVPIHCRSFIGGEPRTFPVRLSAFLDKVHALLGKLLQGQNDK